jgi:ribosome-binding protein aMBF1 (putative translation factor)
MRLLALLTADVRATIVVADLAGRGQAAEQIARVVRKPPPVVDAIARGPAAAPAAVLARRLERCWEAELRVKSSGEPRAELTALVLDLCR